MLMFDNIFSADLQAFCLQVFDWTSHSIFLPSTHQCCGLWLLLLCSVSRFGPRHLLFYLHTPEAWTVIILLACCQHASVSNPVSAWTHSCTAWALWLHCSVYTCRGRIQLHASELHLTEPKYRYWHGYIRTQVRAVGCHLKPYQASRPNSQLLLRWSTRSWHGVGISLLQRVPALETPI